MEKFKRISVDEKDYYFLTENLEVICPNITNSDNLEKLLANIASSRKNPATNAVAETPLESFPKTEIGIYLISGCNLCCRYCYLSASKLPIRKLKEDDFISRLAFLEKEKTHHITFAFVSGGEPTLNFELLSKIPNICRDAGFSDVSFELTTNGTLLNDDMIRFIKENHIRLHVSFDGGKNVTDKSRIYKSGKGIFDDVFANIKKLQEQSVDFSCNSLILPHNSDILSAFIFFEENKIHHVFDFSVDSFDGQYSPEGSDMPHFREDLSLALSYCLEKILNNKKLYSDRIISDLRTIHYRLVKNYACGASICGYNIDLDGYIYSCSLNSSSKSQAIGTLSTGIDYAKIRREGFYSRNVDDNSTCRNCWAKYLCGGGCFALNKMKTGKSSEPYNYLCDVLKIYWEELIKLYIQVYPEIVGGNNPNFNWE